MTDDQRIADQFAKVFAEPWWPGLKARLREESPAGLRRLAESMQEQIVELLHGKDLTPGMPKQLTEALVEVKKLTEQLDDYIETPAELAARRQRPGIARLKLKYPRDATVDAIRSALIAFDRLIGGIAKGRLTTAVYDRRRRERAGLKTKGRRKHPVHEWQRQAEALWSKDKQVSKSEIARRIDPKLAHIIRRYIKAPSRLTVR